MLRAFSIFIFILLSADVFANTDKVAVVVDNTIITEKEIYDRKNFFISAQNLTNIKEKEQLALRKAAVESLIDEALLEEAAIKYGFKITDIDVKNFLDSVEKNRNTEPGTFKKKFGANQGVYASFLKKIKGDYIKTRLNNEVLMRGISVSNSEVDDVAIKYVGKDSLLEIREFTVNSSSDKAYKTLRDARKTFKLCTKEAKSKEMTVQTWTKKFSELSKDEKELVFDLKVGEFSAILDKSDGIFMYQICGKKVEGVSDQESDNLMNYLGNKKLNFKMQKYLETIRANAYIKIM